MVPAPFILLPLRLYPSPGTWDPLTHAVQIHPSVHFVVVINPASAPGTIQRPDANYCAAVEALSQYPNVHLLGYVGVSRGERPLDECARDIDMYCGWNDWQSSEQRQYEQQQHYQQPQKSKLRIDGVYLDEVSSDATTADHISRLARHVRETWMQDHGRKGLVVYNPGVPVDASFFSAADCIVVVEDTETKLVEFADVIRANAPAYGGKAAACIHSFKGRGDQLETLLVRLLDLGMAGVFVTDQDGGGYDQWPLAWEEQTRWLAAREKTEI